MVNVDPDMMTSWVGTRDRPLSGYLGPRMPRRSGSAWSLTTAARWA